MSEAKRPFADVVERLRKANLRPTRQRMALARMLFADGGRHVTAESLHKEAQRNHIPVSLATVYNTLHQFTEAGLLREVVVDTARSYFDTNISHHHHFFCEDSQSLVDIPGDAIRVDNVPAPPAGTAVRRVDVVIRVGRSPTDDQGR